MPKVLPLIGIDDGGFQLFNSAWKQVDVFGVIMRGISFTEHIVKTTILKDDPNPTPKIIEMIHHSGHSQNLKAVVHKGVTIGGFGVLDPTQFVDELGIPFIAILKKEPDLESIRLALNNFPDGKQRWEMIQKHGVPRKVREGLWIQVSGIEFEDAGYLVQQSIAVGNVPESLRIAHMIGKAIFDEKLRNAGTD